jgi:hypothetical protein
MTRLLLAAIVFACTAGVAQAQSWGMWNRIGKQTAREYGEPCWSAALSKCTRERNGATARGRGTLTPKRG